MVSSVFHCGVCGSKNVFRSVDLPVPEPPTIRPMPNSGRSGNRNGKNSEGRSASKSNFATNSFANACGTAGETNGVLDRSKGNHVSSI